MTPLAAAARSLFEPGQPAPLFRALEQSLQQEVGHKLFTIMVWYRQSGEAERLYSNDPKAYPVGGRKALVETPYGEQVFKRQQPYLGRTKADIKWAFFDYELIYSLGLGSVINVLVRHDGELLGMINMLHEEHWYRERDLAAAEPYGALLVPLLRKLTS